MLYYLKGYSRLHVQRGNTHFTPLKLPEYAVAKAASGLTDKQFRTLWDMFDEYAYFSETPVYEADGKFLTHDYVAWLRHQEEDFDEDVIMAWVTKIRPMCTFLPIP